MTEEPCPCEEASRENCTKCQDLPIWFFDEKPEKFIGDFPTAKTAPPPGRRTVICPKCGHEFEEWEGVIIV